MHGCAEVVEEGGVVVEDVFGVEGGSFFFVGGFVVGDQTAMLLEVF